MNLHEKWYKIVTSYPFLNLTSFFKTPYEQILQDLNNITNWKDYCSTPRDTEEHTSIKSVNVGKKLEGNNFISSQGWKSFSIFNRTGKSNHTIIHNFLPTTDKMEHLKSYRMIKNHQWTELKDYFTSIQNWNHNKLSLYFHIAFIRIAILEPGGMIPPHNDIPPDVLKFINQGKTTSYNILNSFNISLYQKPGNIFCLDNKLINFKAGDAYWINAGKTHWVVNMSDDIRIHLQIHGLYKKSYRKYIVEHISYIKNATFGNVQ